MLMPVSTPSRPMSVMMDSRHSLRTFAQVHHVVAGELAPAVGGDLAVLASRPTMMWPPKAVQASAREAQALTAAVPMMT